MSAIAPVSGFSVASQARPRRNHACGDLAVGSARFYALSDRLPAETVVDILNNYFDCQVAAITARGGEVLKFMGDGLLAVFPIAEQPGDTEDVCTHVLAAARESRASVEAMHFPVGETIERFRFGVALHVGKVCTAYRRRQPSGTSPASVRRSIWRHGWKRSQAGSIARWWRQRPSSAPAMTAGTISASFRSREFSKAERVYGLLDEVAVPA